MKSLVLSRNIPKKNGHGVQMRLAKHIENLMLQGDVTLLVLDSPSSVHDYPSIKTFYSGIAQPKSNDDISIFSDPENAASLSVEEVSFVVEVIKKSTPDVFFCFRLACGRVLEFEEINSLLRNIPKVLDIDDIESRALFRSVLAEYRIFGKIYSFKKILDSIKLYFLQLKAFKNFDYVFVCSNIDRALLDKKYSNLCHFKVVPNVVSGAEPLPLRPACDVVNLLFVGTMSYHPNARAVHYFVNEIFEHCKARVDKRLHLYIVGHNPPKAIQNYASRDDITVTGGVESLVPYYELSDIVICPIRSGGGTRIKIIEAMAYNRPVVSTTIGAEGIEVTPNETILIADTALDFAAQTIKLTESEVLRNAIAQAGLELFHGEYSMEKLHAIYHELFAEIGQCEQLSSQ